MSSLASYQCNNESRYSSPIASPAELTPVSEFEPSLAETDPASFWVSPELILDSSKVLLVIEEIILSMSQLLRSVKNHIFFYVIVGLSTIASSNTRLLSTV